MEQRVITKEAVVQVLKDYGRQYRATPWRTGVGFLLPAIANILIFFVPPLIVAKIINLFVEQGSISLSAVVPLIVLLGGLWLLAQVFWRIGMHLIIGVEARGLNDLAKTAFLRLAERDYDFYANNFVGSLTKKAFSFSRGFERFTDTMLFNVVASVFPIIFAVVILWGYSPWLPLILLFWVGTAILIGVPIIRRRAKLVAERHEASSRAAGRLSDGLTNILAIKSFAKERQENKTYGDFVDDLSSKFKKAADYQNLRFDMAISPIFVAANVFGLMAAVFFTQRLGLEVGVIVVVFAYYAQVTQIFWQISSVYRNIESSITEAAEFTQLLLEPPAVRDIEGARDLIVSGAAISFRDVRFSYSGQSDREDVFLDSFNFDILSKQKVGLVGPSGGGKTTIMKLLLRYIDLTSGSIKIDEQDIGKVTQRSLREAIAYVPQEPMLFHRTLFENIAYGDEDASEEAVIKAAKLAHAHEFITVLPQGYKTLVGERGIKLSGGQRQRVAIARALLKRAPILVLDEATSSLDSESEKYIQEGFANLMREKTVLVIAHRLSTIKHLDRIIVLDQGRIVQDGSHDELVRQEGLYARLWGHQSGEFLNT